MKQTNKSKYQRTYREGTRKVLTIIIISSKEKGDEGRHQIPDALSSGPGAALIHENTTLYCSVCKSRTFGISTSETKGWKMKMVTLGLFQEPLLVSRAHPGGCEHPTSTRT